MSANMLTQSPHDIRLPTFRKLVPKVHEKPETPSSIAQTWLERFADVLASGDAGRLTAVLHEDSWWRDMLTVTWDLRTVRGLPRIIEFLAPRLADVGFANLRLQQSGRFVPSEAQPIDGLDWIESMFTFDTKLGRGKGMLRLVQDNTGAWKAHMLYTAFLELDGAEAVGKNRPLGGKNSLEGGMNKGNWFERRQRQKEFLDSEPTVLLIGAGQSGLNLAARLQTMGIPSLVVDRNERVGDNWRSRYRTLVTHDPVHTCHMAYLPFPPNWPFFTPKDKLGDWFEAYASIMELNVWCSSTVTSASYSDAEGRWTVTVQRAPGTAGPGGETRTFHPRHVVLCTGHSGEPKIPTFPGQESFKGTVYHGSRHKDATSLGQDLTGKKVLVVGTGNSGHDIAQNYHDAGAAVTMLQRSGTCVVSAEVAFRIMHRGLYDESGVPTEDADVVSQSLPHAVQFVLNQGLTRTIAEQAEEKRMLEGLRRAGFALDFGHDGSGMYRKYVTRGGGYYIDVGCSKLIGEGKIKVVRSESGIEGFTEDGVKLKDNGAVVPADIVVLATGYDNMKTSAEKILGPEVGRRVGDVWDLDEEGELRGIWRPSGMPGMWFMGGNLMFTRIYSRALALQIKAIESGLYKQNEKGEPVRT